MPSESGSLLSGPASGNLAWAWAWAWAWAAVWAWVTGLAGELELAA
jgi:hypothetical protein